MNTIIKKRYYNCVQKGQKWISIARELYLASVAKANWSKKESELKAKLRELSQDKNSIGGGYAFVCTERAGAVNYKAIPVLKEINLDLYRKEDVISWSIKRV